MKVSKKYPVLERNIGLAEREISTMVYIYDVQKPSVLRLPDRC
jgi:hypothetical protein